MQLPIVPALYDIEEIKLDGKRLQSILVYGNGMPYSCMRRGRNTWAYQAGALHLNDKTRQEMHAPPELHTLVLQCVRMEWNTWAYRLGDLEDGMSVEMHTLLEVHPVVLQCVVRCCFIGTHNMNVYMNNST